MTENYKGGALVEVFGEEYEIATTDARQVRKIAAYVDAKMCEITESHGGRVPTAKLAVLAAMTIAHEFFGAAHEQDEIAQENLNRLTHMVDERADIFSSMLDGAGESGVEASVNPPGVSSASFTDEEISVLKNVVRVFKDSNQGRDLKSELLRDILSQEVPVDSDSNPMWGRNIPKVSFNHRLDKPLVDAVTDYCKKTGSKKTDVLRMALWRWLNSTELSTEDGVVNKGTLGIKMISSERPVRIKVVGVGDGGGSAINRMIQSGMHGVEFIAINTDVQALEASSADFPLYIGDSVIHGLGAGVDPEEGRKAIERDSEKVAQRLQGADLVFVIAGMGGSTGTGAAPVVAEIARQQGALAVGIVTEPFMMEGSPRMNNARSGIEKLQEHVDTLITIKNQHLLKICGRETTLKDAFNKADEVLMQATSGIADVITIPGMINLDFNDLRNMISKGGDAIVGVGTHSGENRAVEATRKAINSPLLEGVSISGAKGVVINITADSNLTLFEVNEAMSLIHEITGGEAAIIFGTVIDDSLGHDLRVTVIRLGSSIK